MIITEQGKFERRCTEILETTYDDHNCYKYSSLEEIEHGGYIMEERKLIKVIM